MSPEPWPDKAESDRRQQVHDQLRLDDETHDLSSCWCCCDDCDTEDGPQ